MSTNRATVMLPCPVECGRYREPGKAMCRTCWGQVPKQLQDQLYAAWRRRRRRGASLVDMADYRQTLNACIAEAQS